MTWLFTIVVVGVCLGVAVTVRTVRQQNATITRRGPVPGYSFTPGEKVDLGGLTNGEGTVRWSIGSLEEFHSENRTRLILSVDLERGEGDRLGEAMLGAARRLRERVPVDVVLVEAGTHRLLFSPDGRGWSGEGDTQVKSMPGKDSVVEDRLVEDRNPE